MAIKVGLDSTKVLLTDVGKKRFLELYSKSTVCEYDEDKPFDLMSLGEDFVEVTYLMGIPYRVPIYVNGKITFQMAEQEEPWGLEPCGREHPRRQRGCLKASFKIK